MSIQIEKGIPVPSGSEKIGEIYPTRSMEVGDSFFVTNPPKSFQSNVVYAARLKGMKLATRTVTEDGVVGIRVWRIA
jgi:hypothetical protein